MKLKKIDDHPNDVFVYVTDDLRYELLSIIKKSLADVLIDETGFIQYDYTDESGIEFQNLLESQWKKILEDGI